MKLFFTIAILFVFSQIFGQIQFEDLSLMEAVLKAKTEDKAVFVDVYTTWCGPCKNLDKQTFQDKEL